MKLMELLTKVDLSKYNKWNDDDVSYIFYELVPHIYTDYLESDERYKYVHIFEWLCTDTNVGYVAHFLDGIFIALSYQECRGCDKKFYWLDKDSTEKMKDYCFSLYEKQYNILSPSLLYFNTDLPLDTDMDVGGYVTYSNEAKQDCLASFF